ncbi:helix-turn-helix domain-containing protein [Clostridium cellulovorans]|uniref:Transcriptional regulator, XRE family n=1 Tax=Clostridium cellulovorans (strain ATCC 35296 / DSM 3052 / OCM 3 / 743B) TaxID=573061 RepID=D9SRP0_CLOC7|nr:helix-turn-helix domain-containing protein [Clostridium cellulovorans]ADL50407.1 transcriptional regulator, XRE family [Clostridium cellulovorans 743B]
MNNSLANRIKDLRKNNGYTQKELSSLLGIGQTTVANYEQGTRIPDTEKLNKMADLFEVTLDYLLGRNEKISPSNKEVKSKTIDLKSANETYLEYLLKGDSKKARKFILSLHEEGIKIDYIFFNILDKVLKNVGILWEKGIIDVWKEHFISEVTIDVMKEIKFREENRNHKSISIIALNPGSELHNIGLRMISDILELEGYHVIYLGSNVPVQSLIKGIEIENPKFIAISVTLEHHIDSAIYMISAIKNYFGKSSPKIVIGGSAFINYDKVCERTGADYYSLVLDDILDILNNTKAY